MAIYNDVAVSFNVEYRSMKDDAWYTCGVVLEDGKRLRVKFKDFVLSHFDEVFSVSDFSASHKIKNFLHRFRPVSMPIEDNVCSRVIEGMIVCAVYRGDKELLYYDAIIDAVHYKEHTPEKCLCAYLLSWQHGPNEGNITATNLEDIYVIMHGAIDPAITDFIKLVKENLKGASFQFTPVPKNPFLSKKTSSNETHIKSQEFGTAGHISDIGFSEGKESVCPKLSDEDKDLGGVKATGYHHYIILENLEKDICPLLMMDFIHEQTLITAETYVFPSLLGETYARGAIVVNSETKLKRIYEFINNPNHFIVSFSGRPWVIAENKLRNGTFKTNLQNLQSKYENYNTKNELKVVRLGTEEYTKAKKLKDLFMEFRNHINGLVQRLGMEEKKNQDPNHWKL